MILARSIPSPEPCLVSTAQLARRLASLCPGRRIDLAGAVVLPCPLPHRERWLRWVNEGRDGNLSYLTRDAASRADPTGRNPWAGTLLVFGQRYTDGWPAEDRDPVAGASAGPQAPWTSRVSRYARGRDYHDVLLKDIKAVLNGLREEWPDLVAFAATDTGPYLEREYAWLAGLGFLGRNRCLIHEKLGSGIFLGVALTNLQVTGLPAAGTPAVEPLYGVRPRRLHPPQTAPWELCGSCTRCLDACPTGALDLETGLDAHLCLSTWTIEWRGQAPPGEEGRQGGLLFGCDICQAVCPWNRRAAGRAGKVPAPPVAYAPLSAHAELSLADLAEIDDDDFRRRFRKTPIWRCHAEGMRRNARTVLQNLEEETE